MLYNEIIHYRQFMTFYQKWIERKVKAMALKPNFSEKEVRMYQSRLDDFKRYYDMQMEATSWAER
jgi:hypothetical protein